jgi:predicted amidophosphoribosyltransferase
MDIDLEQLPIPDWGLTCPHCAYPLKGLPAHRCPECGRPFRIDDLIGPWTRLRSPTFTGSELPLPDFGLHCARCDQPLAGAMTRTCPHCAAPFDPRAWLPREAWFLVTEELCHPIPSPAVQALLAAELIPYIPVGERSVTEIYGVQNAVTARVRVPREFYFDVRWHLRRAAEDARRCRTARAWRCPACGERNPANFEVCWNCAAPPASA